MLLLGLPLGVLLAAFLALDPWRYPALDPWLLFAASSAFSLPLPVIYLLIGRRLLRAARFFSQPMPSLIAATLLAWLGGAAMAGPVLNGRLDAGAETTHVALVEGKHIAQGGRGASHRLRMASWRQPGAAEEIAVAGDEYERAVPGRTRALVAVRPGRFGFPWLARCELQ